MYDAMMYTNQIEFLQKNNRNEHKLEGSKEFLSGLKTQDKLKPIFPIIFYYGEEPWEENIELHDLLDFPEELKDFKAYLPNYKLNIVQASNVSPDLFKTGMREVFEMLRFGKNKVGLQNYMEEHKERYEHLEEDTSELIGIFMGVEKLMGENKGKVLLEQGKTEELRKVFVDKQYRKALFENFCKENI